MMKPIKLLIVLFSISTFSQTIDYNTKKGFGAEGYDVVSYFNNAPKEGKKEFTTEVDGVRYKFSSKENLTIFNNDPETYLPQYGGYCAYAVALKSKKVPVDPKTYKIINNKLYLFYNAWGTNTLELWDKENEDSLLVKGNQNWNIIKFEK